VGNILENLRLEEGNVLHSKRGTTVSSVSYGTDRVVVKRVWDEPVYVARLENEHAFLRVLHPLFPARIPEPIEFSRQDNAASLVMEYFDAPDLEMHISTGKFSISRAAQVGADLGRLVKDINDRNVYHRDIKPKNILLNGNAKVIDLGIAKSRRDLESEKIIAGTPGFMPPELMRFCFPPYTPHEQLPAAHMAADKYGVACIVYELLTGEEFQKAPKKDVMAEAMEGALPGAFSTPVIPIPFFTGYYQRKFVKAVIASLDPNPKNRPSFAEFILACENAM
jgi:serine/threonine protein kinase